MRKTISLGLVLSALMATDAIAVPMADSPSAHVTAPVAPARPTHARLRYDASADASCRSFSDASTEICLLLALHVIRMSQKPLAGAEL